MESMTKLTKIQKERLSHIEFRAYFFGSVGRKDLIERFGIKDAAATRDFTKYNDLAPDNLMYDTRNRTYVPSDKFKPIFDYSTTRVLSTFAEGFGDGLRGNELSDLQCETPYQINQPDIGIVASLTRGMKSSLVVEITYNSISSGKTKRQIVPFALIDTGLRWHIRAWDRRRERFTDFVVTRIERAVVTKDKPKEHELAQYDKDWNEFIEIKLIPHPQIVNKETVEIDYGMKDGERAISLRKAILGYVLRRWNVDCSSDYSLRGMEYQLALKNADSIKVNIETMILAPGFHLNEP
tara:strand:- start:15974 stop:16858 length:885 start_codon:yes stop_codon:yes gene_type:complete